MLSWLKIVPSRFRPGKRRRAGGTGPGAFLERSLPVRVLILAASGAGAVGLLAWRGGVMELPPEGTVCARDITASLDFSFPDPARTEELRRLAADRQPFGYSRDGTVLDGQLESLAAFSRETAPSPAGAAPPLPEATAAAEKVFRAIAQAGVFDPDVRGALIESGDTRIAVAEGDGYREIPLESTLTPDSAYREAGELLRAEESLTPDASGALLDFIRGRLRPNLIFSQTLTARLRRVARDKIETVVTRIRRGALIAGAGEPVTREVIERMRAYRQEQIRRNPAAARMLFSLGTGIMAVLVMGAGGAALVKKYPRLVRSNSSLLLLSLVFLGSMALTRVLVQSWWHLDPALVPYLRYAAPIPGAVFIVCLLLGQGPAVILGLTLSALAGMAANFDGGTILAWSLTALASAVFVRGARRRGGILRAGFRVAAVSSMAVIALGLISGPGAEIVFRQTAGAALSGVICALAVISALGIIEGGFRRYSDIGLLELSDMNHPLLREMMLKAPGTHHHSLMVSTMAEAAAEAIGANPILCRVGALFHDVGKTTKPEYFVENIFGGPNSHDRLLPSMSSLILISHVKDGVDLAARHRLDRRIVDIIEQHHGTCLISYFFDRAERSRQLNFAALEKDFRYPGPRPQTMEAAIVMLSDAIEAATTALDRPTADRIESQVRAIIQERFADAQLDESRLSLSDLNTIAEVLTRHLTARFHLRVKYPGNPPAGGAGEYEKPVQ